MYVRSAASVLLAALVFHIPAYADDLDYRVDKLEARLKSSGMLSVAEDVSRLQSEVRELRGEVERLQYENDQAKIRQREMYLDLEKRMQEIEKGLAQKIVDDTMSVPPTGADTASTPEAAQPAPAGSSASTGATGKGEEAEYLASFELLKQGRYTDAIQGFKQFLAKHPQSEYADNAQYWLAEAYYVNRDYPASLNEFGKLVSLYPQSAKLPGALLKMGYINYERGEYAAARDALSRVTREFPESSAASLARQRLQRMDTEGR